MKNKLCTGSTQRNTWAVSLCFAAAMIMALEALHPSACVYFDMSADDYFSFSAIFATLATFLGSFILMRSLGKLIAKE